MQARRTAVSATDASTTLQAFWDRLNLGDPPFVHPDDRAILRHPYYEYRDVDSFVHSLQFGKNDGGLQLGLMPCPFAGDLSRANVFVLLLNPGFEPVDLFGEHEVPAFSRAIERTLRQDLADEAFPNVYLNPEFCWSGAYRWWESKVRDVARAYQMETGEDYWRSLQVISEHLATIELFPYHSVSSPPPFARLPSVMAARTFVTDTLVPRALAGEITIVVTRRAVDWGLGIL